MIRGRDCHDGDWRRSLITHEAHSGTLAAEARKSFTVGELAERLGASLEGPESLVVDGLNALDLAGPTEISFIGSETYGARWVESKAIAAAVTQGVVVPGHDARTRALLRVPDADLALAELLALFAPEAVVALSGIHPDATVDPTAQIDPSASIGARCTVGAGTTIGAGTVLETGVNVGSDVTIGRDCIIRAGVVIRERCTLGDRVSIHSNSVIGSDGFGYRPDGRGGIQKLPHIGTVEIQDDVEIGACSTVDRAKFGKTVIGAHTKIDNLVQIGHNVRIGRGCVLAAQTGVAGTVEIGDYCQLGAKSGVADHLRVGSQVRIAAMTGLSRDAVDGAELVGAPATDRRHFWQLQAALRRLPELIKTVARLEQQQPTPSDGHSDSP